MRLFFHRVSSLRINRRSLARVLAPHRPRASDDADEICRARARDYAVNLAKRPTVLDRSEERVVVDDAPGSLRARYVIFEIGMFLGRARVRVSLETLFNSAHRATSVSSRSFDFRSEVKVRSTNPFHILAVVNGIPCSDSKNVETFPYDSMTLALAHNRDTKRTECNRAFT